MGESCNSQQLLALPTKNIKLTNMTVGMYIYAWYAEVPWILVFGINAIYQICSIYGQIAKQFWLMDWWCVSACCPHLVNLCILELAVIRPYRLMQFLVTNISRFQVWAWEAQLK